MTDSLTLTVKDRLARRLLFRHDRLKAQAKNKVWERPAIYFMDDWLQQAWLQSWPGQYVLTELQSKHLWQKIIREDSATPDLNLLHVQGAAWQAFKAYQLIRQYRLPEDPAGFNHYTEETKTFRRWMTRYQKQLQEWQALDPSELLDGVLQRMEQGHIPLPGKINFHGFDEITPQHNDWLKFLKGRSVQIHFKPFEPTPVPSENLRELISHKHATVQKYEDAREEVVQCARWIRSTYQEGQTIGIVVPEMEVYRDIIEREFKAELVPASVYPWEDQRVPFNISMGTPLSNEPMVHLALLLLGQRNKRIPLITFSTLITSPFIKNPPDETQFRRDLEWNLRGGTTTHVFLSKVLDAGKKKQCPALVAFLDQLMDWVDDTSFRLPSEWARGISIFLKAVGWPTGHGTLSSRQFQALESWKASLDSLSSLDQILQEINRHQAVSHLTHIAEETPFQPQTRDESIQILDLPESAGMEFDHLWIMGCHAESLPPIPAPNPFLPFLSHQQPYNLPHSTAERELRFTEQSLFRLAHACNHLVFSYPAWQGESEMVPSPLLAPWLLKKNTIQSSTSHQVQDHPDFAVQLERVEDYFPIPVSAEEKKFIKGGYSLIKNQAECPFRAFAVHRLASQQKEFAELDTDASIMGRVVHKILELFWKEVRTSERLNELNSSDQLRPKIQHCVEEGMRLSPFDPTGQQAFFKLEKDRLTSLIHEWLEMERKLRQNPFEVQETEKSLKIQLEGLNLDITLDRMDKTEGGKILLIDYKTGAVDSPKKWFEERMEHPQLPLYALQVQTDAVAYANVKPGEFKFRGIATQDNLIPKLESDFSKYNHDIHSWDDLKNFWKINLNRIAKEFLEGHLKVAPLHAKDTCKYCDQVTFCRKTELLASANGEEE